ncbi:cytochrome c oxidase subunit 7B, mitochondrial [Nematolebias whitei]|uniref:cytochrome c oxidase subunit 7B, mitochondrial n=1 Tax=Nematolebias whitei TaxID=451745 RepID=UPI00189B63D8|nr:cytochrome c oxidase subunit 7B, mitochondrial [Nematolebias whitei]
MYRFAKAAAILSGQAVRQVGQVRHESSNLREFHAKYGSGILISGVVFCTSIWSYVITQSGITWGLSPVNKLQPKPWREAEE